MSGKTSSAAVEYRETGVGPTVVFAPGSCCTGAAWRPVVAHLNDARAITTSLSAYGDTAQRRTSADRSITPVAERWKRSLSRLEAGCIWLGIRSAAGYRLR